MVTQPCLGSNVITHKLDWHVYLIFFRIFIKLRVLVLVIIILGWLIFIYIIIIIFIIIIKFHNFKNIDLIIIICFCYQLITRWQISQNDKRKKWLSSSIFHSLSHITNWQKILHSTKQQSFTQFLPLHYSTTLPLAFPTYNKIKIKPFENPKSRI